MNLSIAAKYKITFTSGRKDSQGDAPTLENAAAGTVITLPENSFKVYGMNFEGWSDDGSTTYASGASYTMPEGNVTFEAVWNLDKWDGATATKPTNGMDKVIILLAQVQSLRISAIHLFRNCRKPKLMCDIDLG